MFLCHLSRPLMLLHPPELAGCHGYGSPAASSRSPPARDSRGELLGISRGPPGAAGGGGVGGGGGATGADLWFRGVSVGSRCFPEGNRVLQVTTAGQGCVPRSEGGSQLHDKWLDARVRSSHATVSPFYISLNVRQFYTDVSM